MDAVMELEIGPGPDPGSYVARVLRSVGGGEPTETITLDLDDLLSRRPYLEASVLSSSVSARRVMSDTEAALQDVGRRLFESTFTGSIATAYRTSKAVASERGTSVQIALRLTAPGLAALPWEALYDAETQTYLCRKEPLVRNVPAPHAPTALAVASPLRVLAMVSSPRGLPALDVDAERERLEVALKPQLDAGRVELHWLEDVSWEGVHRMLLESEWHVLHFIGHGTYDVETDEGVLAFVGRDGRADYVTASTLSDLLDEAEPTPRLVVLNSCQSAAGGTTDLFSGTAAALAHSGIRAVAAMQFSISDTAALAFARGFYTALAHGRGIDEAVRSGRIGILGIVRGTLEWVTPVLYLRGADAHLFDVVPTPDTTAAQPPAEPTVIGDSVPITAGAAKDARPRRRTAPATPVASAASGPERPTAGRSRRMLWLVVGVIAVVAAGGVTAALLTLPLGGEGGSEGEDSPSTADLAVRMDTDWVDTGLYCYLGDEFVIEVNGRAWLDESPESVVGPDGLTEGERPEDRVFDGANTASVIGRLNTTPEIFAVGNGTTYTCPAQGNLELGINDTDLADNSGEFGAFVTLNQ